MYPTIKNQGIFATKHLRWEDLDYCFDLMMLASDDDLESIDAKCEPILFIDIKEGKPEWDWGHEEFSGDVLLEILAKEYDLNLATVLKNDEAYMFLVKEMIQKAYDLGWFKIYE